jgi:hypothetical protein
MSQSNAAKKQSCDEDGLVITRNGEAVTWLHQSVSPGHARRPPPRSKRRVGPRRASGSSTRRSGWRSNRRATTPGSRLRLVPAALEARWNSALERVRELEARLAAFDARTDQQPHVDERALHALAQDVPALWHDPRPTYASSNASSAS